MRCIISRQKRLKRVQNMKSCKDSMLLYAVTDRRWLNGETLRSQVEKALKGGVTCIQLREKEMVDSEFLAEALDIKELCSQYDVPLIINDNVDVALKCHADGIHVGQSDMNAGELRQIVGDKMIIGVSASTAEQALEAVRNGADYIGTGAVFPTSTKDDASDVSIAELTEICSTVSIPVVAIGGITKENTLKLSGSGIAGIAVVSAIFAQPDIEAAARELRKLSEKAAGMI